MNDLLNELNGLIEIQKQVWKNIFSTFFFFFFSTSFWIFNLTNQILEREKILMNSNISLDFGQKIAFFIIDEKNHQQQKQIQSSLQQINKEINHEINVNKFGKQSNLLVVEE